MQYVSFGTGLQYCRFITIQSFPSGFREKLWVGLGLGIEIGLGRIKYLEFCSKICWSWWGTYCLQNV